MLEALGLASVDDLFSPIPDALRIPSVDLPAPKSEMELAGHLASLAEANRPLSAYSSFVGGGVYRRYIPALVRSVLQRPEFYSAYTPYQAEASQGTLQSIYEFQTMMCELTELDVANASLYDGGTALGEAAILALLHTERKRIAVVEGVYPEHMAVLLTMLRARHVACDVIPLTNGTLSREAVTNVLTDAHAALIVPQPTIYGTVLDYTSLPECAHAVGALAISDADPLALLLVTPPGEAGFDVVTGDGQQLGIPLSYGGPHVGYMVVRDTFIRKIPGRLAGATVDAQGERAFTLTLQAREQHIRRERATSNVCTNHALMALATTVYMAELGAGGLKGVATTSASAMHRLARALSEIEGFTLTYPEAPYLWEATITLPGSAEAFSSHMREQGILPGIPLRQLVPRAESTDILIACTEYTTPDDIDAYIDAAHSWRTA